MNVDDQKDLSDPMKTLLDAARRTTNNTENKVLRKVQDLSLKERNDGTSEHAEKVNQFQMSLNRALTGIKDARKKKNDEIKQLCGFLALTAVCVGVFYYWMKFRPTLWHRMKVPMASCALVTAVIVLAVTGLSIFKPIEGFEVDQENFCEDKDKCTDALESWAVDAANQTYVSALDATASLTSKLIESRDENLESDLATVSRRMYATDIEYRAAVFAHNRVRQAKRFVVMTLAIALLLMVVLIMGMPGKIVFGLHVAASVVLLTVAVLVYKGNAMRFRKNWNQVYYRGPEDV
jgi:cation transport ATPase